MRTVRKEKAKNQAGPQENHEWRGFPPPASEAKAVDVVGLGENSVDLLAVLSEFPRPDTKVVLSRLAPMVGGQALTATVACARLGGRARYVGGVGDDAEGRTVLQALSREGVEAQVRMQSTARTRRAVILVDAKTGSRTVLEDRDPHVALKPEELVPEVVAGGRVLLIDARDPALSAAAAQMARAAGVPVVLDVEQAAAGIEALLRVVDIIVASAPFPSALTGARDLGRALRRLAKLSGAAMVVVTLGRDGSLALVRGREVRTRAFRVPAVDTTGAGDAFRGGLISAWLASGALAKPADVLRYANAVAALNCTGYGALAALPTRPEVEAFVTRVRRGQSK